MAYEYTEEFTAEVSRLANSLMDWAGKECTDENGVMNSLLFAMAAAQVVGSNASLLPNGPELMHRMIVEMGEMYRSGFSGEVTIN